MHSSWDVYFPMTVDFGFLLVIGIAVVAFAIIAILVRPSRRRSSD
jgi:hypothetical protein